MDDRELSVTIHLCEDVNSVGADNGDNDEAPYQL